MKVSELINSCNYKQVFNIIYKQYLHNKSVNSIIEIDLEIQKAYNHFSKVNCSPEQIEETHSLYLLYTEDEKIDICIHEEGKDELLGIDIYDWTQLACLDIKNGCKLSNPEIAAEILWETTQWGDNESIKKMLKDIESTINYLTD